MFLVACTDHRIAVHSVLNLILEIKLDFYKLLLLSTEWRSFGLLITSNSGGSFVSVSHLVRLVYLRLC